MHNTIKKVRQKHGSVLAEAALIIPLLIGVTFFLIEFGNVLYFINSLNHIARTAARYASITTSYTGSSLVSNAGASSFLNTSNLTLTFSPDPSCPRSIGSTITIMVSYSYTPVINPFGLLNSSNSWAPVIMSSSVVRSEVSCD